MTSTLSIQMGDGGVSQVLSETDGDHETITLDFMDLPTDFMALMGFEDPDPAFPVLRDSGDRPALWC